MEDENNSDSAPPESSKLAPSRAQKRRFLWLDQQIRSKLFLIHSIAPNLIPSPYPRDKNYVEERDKRDNAESSITADQSLELGCIWAAEFFGPNEIEGLYSGLRSLGWDVDKHRRGSDALSWLTNQRRYGNGGIFYLNRIVRKSDTRSQYGIHLVAEIPRTFDSLIGAIYQITPSLTCLLICFQMSDGESASLARAMNSDYRTSYEKVKGLKGYRILSARHNKEKALSAIMESFRSDAVTWMGKYFPGYFWTKSDPRKFPTAELMITKSYSAFDLEQTTTLGNNHWSHLVGLNHYFNSWIEPKRRALAFRFDERFYDTRNHTTVTLNSDRLTDEDLKHTGGDSLGSRVAYCFELMSGVLTNYFAIGYLNEIRRQLSQVREQIKAQELTPDAGLSTLTDLEKFFAGSIGTPVIARELVSYAKEMVWLRESCSNFVRQRYDQKDDTKLDISSGLSQALLRMAEMTMSEDSETRNYLEQYSSILGIRESVKAQRTAKWISIAATGIALAALFWS